MNSTVVGLLWQLDEIIGYRQLSLFSQRWLIDRREWKERLPCVWKISLGWYIGEWIKYEQEIRRERWRIYVGLDHLVTFYNNQGFCGGDLTHNRNKYGNIAATPVKCIWDAINWTKHCKSLKNIFLCSLNTVFPDFCIQSLLLLLPHSLPRPIQYWLNPILDYILHIGHNDSRTF